MSEQKQDLGVTDCAFLTNLKHKIKLYSTNYKNFPQVKYQNLPKLCLITVNELKIGQSNWGVYRPKMALKNKMREKISASSSKSADCSQWPAPAQLLVHDSPLKVQLEKKDKRMQR